MQGTLMDQGLELMLFGMGTVLAFLTLLVLSISLMSWVLTRYFPVAEIPSGAGSTVKHPPPGVSDRGSVDAKLIAVISAAIHRHRSKKSP